jgi:phage shock protein B
MDGEFVVGMVAIVSIFVGLPWLIFHYVTKWKTAKTLTVGDEQLLDDLHDMARRLEERMVTIERIMNAENPNWRHTFLPESDTALPDEIVATRSRRGEKA